MADGIIQKIIRIILDQKSAKDTEEGVKGVTQKIDDAWKDTAKKIAGYLGLAFLTKKVIEFGTACVAEATKSQDAWSELEGSIDAVGGSFDSLNEKLRLQADAFQAATIHDDDDYAVSLGRLVSLTGDVGASTNNMGLVANVAAKFFKGDLAPATDLVAKAMNGNTAALKKMGIQVESAQEGLNVLAQRSMGAAEKRAATFTGQIAQLKNGFGDFQKGIGEAIIESDGAATAMNFLQVVVQKLTDWVGRNREAISTWVTRGVNFAIYAIDVLWRALYGVAALLAGGLQTSLGLAGKAIAFSAKGWVGLANAASLFLEAIGQKGLSDKLDVMTGTLLAQANALDIWADAAIKAGSEKVKTGLDTFTKPVFVAKDLAKGGKDSKGAATLPALAPQMGSNAALSDAEKAWAKFDTAIDNARHTITGANQDLQLLEAQADAIKTLLQDLTAAGVKPADEAFGFLQNALKGVNSQIETTKQSIKIQEDFKAFADETMAAERTANAFGTRLQDLQGEAQRLTKVIQNLIADGIDPHDEKLQGLIARLKEVQGAIDGETASMQFQQQVAGDLAQALFASFGGGLGPFARMKAKQNYLEATENGIRAALAALTGFGALHAGKYAAAAGQHLALGAAWSALASSVGGPSGGGAAPTATSAANPSSGLGTSRASTGSASRNAQQPEAVTEIHFVGPGFDALNPQVQKVVRGAQQEAIERAGKNTRVRVVRS